MPKYYNLDRFLTAQHIIYDRVVQELLIGKKSSHWMWFIFPQLKGLGKSEMAQQFAISDQEEARAYLAHDELGPRIMDCTMLVCRHTDKSAISIFGEIDAMKFHSSMTLFSLVDEPDGEFAEALAQFYNGEADPATLSLLHS